MTDSLAYKTMFEFLDERYRRMPSDTLGALLGDLLLQPDGLPADPAVVAEWERAFKRAESSSEAVSLTRRKAG